jgi:3-oxoacyl-[acyl-carrier protein] reductase
MRKNHWGRIVNISSIWSVTVKEHRVAYCASKFGLVGMSKALAVEVAADGILVNCIAPGYIETEATRSAFDVKELQEAASTIPIRRFGRPDEVAALASWLASNDNGYLTGQNILLDGGLSSI